MCIKQGAEVWNRWSKENPRERPDLSGADFTRSDLNGAELTGAALCDVDLTEADLRQTSLIRTDLYTSIFNRTWFDSANFDNAFASGTVSVNVDLSICSRHALTSWWVDNDGRLVSNCITMT